MCDRGEPVAPHAVFDVDNVVHNFAFSQGVNPLVNLVNASFEQVKAGYSLQIITVFFCLKC